jgi:hypothetical protein
MPCLKDLMKAACTAQLSTWRILFWVSRLVSLKDWPIVLALRICPCKHFLLYALFSSSVVPYLALLISSSFICFLFTSDMIDGVCGQFLSEGKGKESLRQSSLSRWVLSKWLVRHKEVFHLLLKILLMESGAVLLERRKANSWAETSLPLALKPCQHSFLGIIYFCYWKLRGRNMLQFLKTSHSLIIRFCPICYFLLKFW